MSDRTKALERLDKTLGAYDVDNLILYGDSTPLTIIQQETARCKAAGETFQVQRSIPDNLRYRTLVSLFGSEVAQ